MGDLARGAGHIVSTARDRAIADDAGAEFALRCRAHGCPMLWSVNFGTKLCSAHARCISPTEWPRVTEQLLEAETERAYYGAPPAAPAPAPLTREEAVAQWAEVREGRLFARQAPKDWARRLKALEEGGRPLSAYQRAAWRAAFGHEVLDAARAGASVPRGAITEALQATGDLPMMQEAEA